MNFRPYDEFTFRLAIFLKETDTPSISKTERFRESEKLFLMLRNRYPDSAQIDVELANLYYRCEKYASALGYLLRAKLKNHTVDSEVVSVYQRRLMNDSLELGDDPYGAYLLGSILIEYGLVDKGIYLLERSIEFGQDKLWAGFAALNLADAYRGRNEKLRLKYLKLASDLGNPEILRPRNSFIKAVQ